MIDKGELYEFGCIKKYESEKALLVIDPASGEEIWIPFSQIDSMHFDAKGEGTVRMTAWIAKQKGLI